MYSLAELAYFSASSCKSEVVGLFTEVLSDTIFLFGSSTSPDLKQTKGWLTLFGLSTLLHRGGL